MSKVKRTKIGVKAYRAIKYTQRKGKKIENIENNINESMVKIKRRVSVVIPPKLSEIEGIEEVEVQETTKKIKLDNAVEGKLEELTDLKGQIEGRENIQIVEEEKESIEEVKEEKDTKNENLKKNFDELQMKFDQITLSNSELTKTIENLTQNNENFLKEKIEIENVLQQTCALFDVKESNLLCDVIKTKIEEWNQKQTENNKILQEKDTIMIEELEKLQKKHQENRKGDAEEFEQKLKEVHEIHSKIQTDLSETVGVIENKIEMFENKLEKVNELNEEKHKVIEELNERIKVLQGDNEDLKYEIISLKKDDDIKQKQLDSTNSLNYKLKNKLENTQELIKKEKEITKKLFVDMKKMNVCEVKSAFEDFTEQATRMYKGKSDENMQFKNKIEEFERSEANNLSNFKKQMEMLETAKKEEGEQYEKQKEFLENENMELKRTLTQMKIELQKISTNKQELSGDLKIKDEFMRDLENQIQSLTESNMYYKNATEKAEEIIAQLRSNRIAVDFGVEVEKMKRKHNKEIALLKMKLEEAENKN